MLAIQFNFIIFFQVEHDYLQKEEKWSESKKSLEERIHALQSEVKVKEAEVFSKVKCKGDARLTSAYNKLEAVEAEVESLKTVLDLKTKEVHQLRNENVRLEEKLEEFDKVNLDMRKASAMVEDLKEQVAKKTNLER